MVDRIEMAVNARICVSGPDRILIPTPLIRLANVNMTWMSFLKATYGLKLRDASSSRYFICAEGHAKLSGWGRTAELNEPIKSLIDKFVRPTGSNSSSETYNVKLMKREVTRGKFGVTGRLTISSPPPIKLDFRRAGVASRELRTPSIVIATRDPQPGTTSQSEETDVAQGSEASASRMDFEDEPMELIYDAEEPDPQPSQEEVLHKLEIGSDDADELEEDDGDENWSDVEDENGGEAGPFENDASSLITSLSTEEQELRAAGINIEDLKSFMEKRFEKMSEDLLHRIKDEINQLKKDNLWHRNARRSPLLYNFLSEIFKGLK